MGETAADRPTIELAFSIFVTCLPQISIPRRYELQGIFLQTRDLAPHSWII